MGTTPVTPTSPAAPLPPDPFKDLEALESEAAQIEAEVAQKKSDLEAKKSAAQKLKAFLGDTDKIVHAYAAGLPKLTQDLKTITETAAQHHKEVEAVLTKEKVEEIGKAIETIDNDIKTLETDAASAATAAGEKQAEVDKAAAELKQAKATTDNLKQSLSAVEKRIKELRDLREQEAKADAADTPESDRKKAALVLEIERLAADLKPMQPDELKTALIASLTAAKDAQEKLEKATTEAAAAKKASDEAKTKYEAAAKGRLKAILETAAGV